MMKRTVNNVEAGRSDVIIERSINILLLEKSFFVVEQILEFAIDLYPDFMIDLYVHIDHNWFVRCFNFYRGLA